METSKTGRVYNPATKSYEERLDEIKHTAPDNSLPYEDPVVANPEELATYPKAAKKVEAHELEDETGNRLVNVKSSPVREGRNIVRTDTASGTGDGFL